MKDCVENSFINTQRSPCAQALVCDPWYGRRALSKPIFKDLVEYPTPWMNAVLRLSVVARQVNVFRPFLGLALVCFWVHVLHLVTLHYRRLRQALGRMAR